MHRRAYSRSEGRSIARAIRKKFSESRSKILIVFIIAIINDFFLHNLPSSFDEI